MVTRFDIEVRTPTEDGLLFLMVNGVSKERKDRKRRILILSFISPLLLLAVLQSKINYLNPALEENGY